MKLSPGCSLWRLMGWRKSMGPASCIVSSVIFSRRTGGRTTFFGLTVHADSLKRWLMDTLVLQWDYALLGPVLLPGSSALGSRSVGFTSVDSLGHSAGPLSASLASSLSGMVLSPGGYFGHL